jgi:hypothetical protein
MNLFDTIRQAGGGNAFSALAAQYGLSEEQIGKAVGALMPAFSAGLKRSTADPVGVMALMRKLALGGYPQFYQDPAWALGAGRPQGDDALAFLFGSPDAVRALAAQASAFTGVPLDKLAAMLPALAGIVFGGLAQQSTASNPILEAMMEQFRAFTEPQSAAKGPLDRYEEEQAAREGSGAFTGTQAGMMQAGMAAFQAGTSAWQQAVGQAMKTMGGAAAAAPQGSASGSSLFGEMFEPGMKLGEAYQREIEAILNRTRPESRPA